MTLDFDQNALSSNGRYTHRRMLFHAIFNA
jgi:hypothetical protein